ncbi:bacteriohemerythrin [Desulfohalovibrio reitneri]|uniref:bacteriohemerythrin n=1 Tax=Desulfohalovibrio reitneri TaxID=1307759 RepID=UPI0004A76586|nr:bacteriohemerythrin [Desulfohalovibrio reitneri]
MTPRIKWDESYHVGVEAMDRQHDHLTGLINELFEAYMAGREREHLAATIRELSDYAGYHFATEERLMLEHDYPETSAHLDQHLEFTDRVLGFLGDYAAGKNDLSAELLDYLTDWWTSHVSGTDKKLGDFLNEVGAV